MKKFTLKSTLTHTLLTVATSLVLSAQVNATSRSTSYTYYDTAPKQGLLQSIDGPRTDVSDITTLDYDSQGNLILISNALGQTSQIIAHDASGRPLETINANLLHTTFEYDVRGRLMQSSTFPDGESESNGRITTYTYTPAGDIETITVPNGETLTYTYDEARRLIRITDSQGDYIVYEPDLMGNILSETVYASDTSIIQQQTAVYNQLGQLFQSLGAESQTTEYGYDLNGNNNQVTDARTNPTTQAFDALNRLKTVIDAQSGETKYGYDSAGNLSSVINPNNQTTTYTYDGLGNLISLSSPDTGLTTYNSYDAAGNLLQATNANNIVINYTYDPLNRLTEIQYPDNSQNITYSYDGSSYTANDQAPVSHAPIGQRTGMSDSTGTMSWFYNTHGELIQTSQTLAGGSTFITSHRYQAQSGLHTSTTYPGGQVLHYQYDSQGRVIQIDSDNNGNLQPIVSNIQYQPFGGVTAVDYGNGLNLSRTFDLDGRLSTQSVIGDTTIQELSWDYNSVSSVQNLNNLLNAALNQSFDYDELDRLNTAQTDFSLYGLLGFNYDANGNRTQLDDNSQFTDYTINSSNNQTDSASGAQTQSFQYDAKGNITQHIKNGDTFTYLYNQQNRLNQINKNGSLLATYDHNGLGQRTSKTLADGTLTYYLYTANGQLMSEMDTTGTITQEYVYFNGEPLVLVQTSIESLPATDSIYDNLSSQVTYTGTWPTSTVIRGYEGSNYQYHAAQSLSSTAHIIDNGSSGFSITGTWKNSTSISGYHGSNYQHHSTGLGNNAATWVTPSTLGQYEIYANWTAHSNRASNATYTIHHANGTTDISVNQQHNGAQWNLLGTFTLDANSQVTLSDDANGYVIADAIAVQPEGTEANAAQWASLVSSQGSYEVYAKWTAHPNRASNAIYTITHANGISEVIKDQKQSGGQWVLLGNYTLNNLSTISLSSDADGYVIADAIRVTGGAAVGNSQNKVYYYHNDHLGTPQVLTDKDQNVVWEGHYSPFGRVTTSIDTVENNLRFAGQYFDAESGLHYNYHRYYDPQLGRYITSDPIGLEGGLNTYSYVYQNPLNLIDPYGLDVMIQTTDSAGGLHQRIAVNSPNGSGQWGQSFGHTDGALGGIKDLFDPNSTEWGVNDGIVYEDGDPTKDIIKRLKTKPCQDQNIIEWLQQHIGDRTPYTLGNRNCRLYSRYIYEMIKNKLKNGDFDEGCNC